MSGLDRELLFKQLENYQIQRHDFLNVFQVIRGYLQLGMPEKVIEYIDESIGDLHSQQEIYKIFQKTIQAILLSWYFDLRLKGIRMEITFPAEMVQEEFWQRHWQEEYTEQFYGYTKECSEAISMDSDPDKQLAEIELHTVDEGFECIFVLYNEDEVCIHRVYTAGVKN